MTSNQAGQRECSRCNRNLTSKNQNADGLCSLCQKDLHPQNENSKPHLDWVMRGKPKEIRRSRNGTPFPLNGQLTYAPEPQQPMAVDSLHHYGTNDLLNELARRRDEAERIISIFNTFKGK